MILVSPPLLIGALLRASKPHRGRMFSGASAMGPLGMGTLLSGRLTGSEKEASCEYCQEGPGFGGEAMQSAFKFWSAATAG